MDTGQIIHTKTQYPMHSSLHVYILWLDDLAYVGRQLIPLKLSSNMDEKQPARMRSGQQC